MMIQIPLPLQRCDLSFQIARPRPPASRSRPILANLKREASEEPKTSGPKSYIAGIRPKQLVARAAVAVLGLGYSGDWSRIGVISKETEGILKLAALLVVPLCMFLIYSIRGKEENPT